MDQKTKISEWVRRFLAMAKLVATWSKDPSTQIGAVITRGKFIVSVGFNGFPRGTSDNTKFYEDKSTKYARVLHAELNAILTAKQDLTDCEIYVTAPPCSQCMAAIIQAGIKVVVALEPTGEFKDRWQDSCSHAQELADEAGIDYLVIPNV